MAQDTATNICTAALRKLRVVDPQETPDDTELDNVFTEFKRMIKTWGSIGAVVWASTEDEHTLTAGTKVYTIGSGGDINTVRPNRVINGTYILSGNIDRPVNIIGQSIYNSISDKDIGIPDPPTKLWYDPQYPLGKIYLWPPGGGTLYLRSYKPLAEPATIAAEIVYPDLYQDAIVWNLAQRMSPEFVGEPTPYIMAMASYTFDEIRKANAANDLSEMTNEIAGLTGQDHSYSIDAG